MIGLRAPQQKNTGLQGPPPLGPCFVVLLLFCPWMVFFAECNFNFVFIILIEVLISHCHWKYEDSVGNENDKWTQVCNHYDVCAKSDIFCTV